MTPTVSVVIATYNYGRYLAGALRSVLAQTFTDYEILVIDDGSTDDTPHVVKPFLGDPRVSYRRTDHVGQPGAKNAGIRAAQGRFIAFLDADDLWLPNKLARQVELLQRDSALGVVHARRRLIDADSWELEYTQPALPRGNVLEAVYLNNFVCFSSVVVRREVFERVGLFDERLPVAIDYDLWLRVAPLFRFDHTDEPLVMYRTGHANLSSRAAERLDVVLRIMRRFRDEGAGGLIDGRVLRRAQADTLCHRAELQHARGGWLATLPWYARALAAAPGHRRAWRGLVYYLVPRRLRQWQRRLRGRPPLGVRQRLVAPPAVNGGAA
jgi:glycosyltransferase involved in cell wall biosynthesis